jgi:hypothetical protein
LCAIEGSPCGSATTASHASSIFREKLSKAAKNYMRPNSSADIVTLSTTPPVVVDVPVAIVRSPSTLVEALELQVVGVMVSFKVKSPDIATLEVGLKGAALV